VHFEFHTNTRSFVISWNFEVRRYFSFIHPIVKLAKAFPQLTSVDRNRVTSYVDFPCFFLRTWCLCRNTPKLSSSFFLNYAKKCMFTCQVPGFHYNERLRWTFTGVRAIFLLSRDHLVLRIYQFNYSALWTFSRAFWLNDCQRQFPITRAKANLIFILSLASNAVLQFGEAK